MSKHQGHHSQSQAKRDESHLERTNRDLASIMGDDTTPPQPVATRPYVGQNVHYFRLGQPNAAVVREVLPNNQLHLTVFTREGNVDPKWNVDQRTEKVVEPAWDFIPNHSH